MAGKIELVLTAEFKEAYKKLPQDIKKRLEYICLLFSNAYWTLACYTGITLFEWGWKTINL